MSSSCCGGNRSCGSDCRCGNGCGGCKMYPDMTTFSETSSTTETIIFGLAPQKEHFEASSSQMGVVAQNGGCNCKCGSNCTCDPCNCK